MRVFKLLSMLFAVTVLACTAKPSTSDDAIDCNLSGQMLASQVLTTQCPTWFVRQPGLDVEGPSGPVLTIQPGVTIEIDPGADIEVGVNGAPGGLAAVGTSTSPITFTSSAANPQPGDWGGILFGAQTMPTAQLEFVNIGYAGNTAKISASPAGSVTVDANTGVLVLLSNVTVSSNGAYGIAFHGAQAGFAPGSGQLTIPDWPAGSLPIAINGNQAGTLPPTLTTGAGGGVFILGNYSATRAGVAIDHDQTWPSLAIPYVIEHGGLIITGANLVPATLTISSPNTVEFQGDVYSGIEVDPTEAGLGNLVASGNVTFTAATTSQWGGILFHITNAGLAGSSLLGVTVDSSTAVSGWGGGGCRGVIAIGNSSICPAGDVAGPTILGLTFTNTAEAIFPIAACAAFAANDYTDSDIVSPNGTSFCDWTPVSPE